MTTINIKQDDTQPAIRVRLKDSDGNRETFPNNGYLLVNILERIGD